MAVTIYDLSEAAEWLRANEGPDGEAESMARVADWLDREIEKRIDNGAIAKITRARGVSRRVARYALTKAKATADA